MTVSVTQEEPHFKKKSLPYLPVILLFSVLCSLFTQILLCSPNFQQQMNAPHSTPATVIDVDTFLPLENGYYSESGNGELTFSAPDYPISGIYLKFADIHYFTSSLAVYGYRTEDGVPQIETIRSTVSDSDYFYIPFPNALYDSIKIHLFHFREPLPERFVESREELYLISNPITDEVTLEHIVFGSELWSETEQALSSISVTTTLLVFTIYYFVFSWFVKHWNTSKQYLPFVVLFFVMLFFFSSKTLVGDDRILFVPQQEHSLFYYSYHRYQTWNSRFFIEIFPYFLVHSLSLWTIISSLLCVLICYCTSGYFSTTTFWKNLLIVSLFLCFPLNTFGEVGWIATTCNYLWVLSLSCYSFLIIAKDLRGEPYSKLFHFSTFIACLYATNQEQSCALLLGFYLVFFLYYLLKKKSVKILLPYFGITLFNLGNHLFSPATQSRYDSIISGFSHFSDYSLLNKSELGYLNTLMNIVSVFTLLPLILCSFVLFIAFLRILNEKDGISGKKVPSCLRPTLYLLFPLFVLCLFSPNFDLVYGLQQKFPAFPLLAKDFTMGGNFTLTPEIGSLFPIIMTTFFLVSFSLAILLTIKNKLTALFSLVLLCAGLASGVILGFSPSIFQFTTFRIFIFFGWGFALIALFLYEEILRDGTKKQIAFFHLGVSFLCLSQIYETIQLVINPFLG